MLEPWPVKIVVDNLLQHKRLPGWIGRPVIAVFGDNQIAILNFAVGAVAAIAAVGALSSYAEKYLTTSVSQWVTHDLRRMLYSHIQRLSLAEYDETRTGDLISRVTSDINAFQDFVNTALFGHDRQCSHAGRHDWGDVLHKLAIHADCPVGFANA